MSDESEPVNLPVPSGKAETEIRALKVHSGVQPIVPQSYEEAFRMAQAICGAGLAPDSYKNDPKKVVIGIMTAMELGVPPLQGLSGIAIINGRPSVWGDLAVALCQSKGAIAKQETLWTGTPGEDTWTCTVLMWRTGQPTPYEGKFSIKDAKLAKLWANASKQPWIQYPDRMQFNRARAFCLRNGWSDHLKGLAIVEEVRDMAPKTEKTVNTDFLNDGAAPRIIQSESIQQANAAAQTDIEEFLG